MKTADLIRARWLEAADVERRLPRVKGPTSGGYWPAYDFDEIERKGWTQADIDEDIERWAARRDITAAELSRYGEVVGWTVDHISHVGMRHLVWCWSFCQVVPGWSFAAECKRRGWVRRTAYHRLERLFERLTAVLGNGATFLRPPAPRWCCTETGSDAPSEHTLTPLRPSPTAVPNAPFRTEPSRDLIATPQDVEAFAAYLADHNAAMAKRQAREARRRQKLGIEG